jgi:hypothetical protein
MPAALDDLSSWDAEIVPLEIGAPESRRLLDGATRDSPPWSRSCLPTSGSLDGRADELRLRIAEFELVADVEIAGVDVDFARELYAARSEAAHGASVGMFRVAPSRAAPRRAGAGSASLP